jgi:hypothetical protein
MNELIESFTSSLSDGKTHASGELRDQLLKLINPSLGTHAVETLIKISWEIVIIRSCQLEHVFYCSLVLDEISFGAIFGTVTPLTVDWILRDMTASSSGLWFYVSTMRAPHCETWRHS